MKKILLTIVILLLTLHAWSQVPKTISFQGYLTDENEDPVHKPKPGGWHPFHASENFRSTMMLPVTSCS